MANIPEYVRTVLNTLEAGGHEACLVGGCLRDMLIGRAIHDWDIATSARGSDIIKLFPKTVETGARFGTITVITVEGPVEVTTFRSDGVYTDKRRPDDVRFVDDLYEDLKRRDFTINAMAMSGDGNLRDPFDGQSDIKCHIIRCVGNAEDRFSEDALRMFRAVRFSAQLAFDIEDGTMAAIMKCAHLCAELSAERVRDETEKMLMSDRPELAGAAVRLGLFAGHLRQAEQLSGLNRISALPCDRTMRWAAFCAVLQSGGCIENTGAFLCDLRHDAKIVKYCDAGVRAAHGRLLSDRIGIKRLLAEIGKDAVLCAAAAEEVLHRTDAIARVEEVLSSGECFSFGDLAVTGDDLIDLGVTPGVALGGILKKLLEHVIEHPEDNQKEFLMRLVRGLRQ